MSTKNYIPLDQLCTHYKLEMSFFTQLNEFGLIEIITVSETHCIHEDRIAELEKMIRLHRELDLNMEGIDTVFNLLDRIKELQNELDVTKNKLRLYE